MADAHDARSLGDLFGDLSREITALVRDEIALARVEMSRKLARAGRHAGMLAMASVVALAGLFTFAAALVLVLIEVGVPAWGAASLVGLGLAAAGALVALRALTALREEDLKPAAAIRILKETAAWTRQIN